MQEEAKLHEEDDKKRKEAIDAKNEAESLVYQSNKTLDEFKDKVSDDLKSKVEAQVKVVEEELKGDDIDKIKAASAELSKVLQQLGAEMYKESEQPKAQPEAESTEENVVDAEFEEK